MRARLSCGLTVNEDGLSKVTTALHIMGTYPGLGLRVVQLHVRADLVLRMRNGKPTGQRGRYQMRSRRFVLFDQHAMCKNSFIYSVSSERLQVANSYSSIIQLS